jgi:predicted Zn finger-like uncharacterized protein
MAIAARCPHCGASYTLRDETQGKTVRCKQCNQTFVAGADQAAEVVPEDIIPANLVPPRTARSRAKEEEFDEPVRRPRTASTGTGRSPLFWILICGGAAVLLLGCCGVPVGLWLFLAPSSFTSGPDLTPKVEVQQGPVPGQPLERGGRPQPAPQPPVAPNPPAVRGFLDNPRAGPTNLNEAVIGLGGNQLQQIYALEWLKKAPVDPLRRDEVARRLVELLKGSDVLLRPKSADALAVWGTREQVPALLDVLDDPKFDLRAAAIEALGAIKDPRAAEPVAKRLPDFSDRRHASRTLIAIGPPAEAAVRPYLRHKDAAVRNEAARILQRIGNPKAEGGLDEALGGLTDTNVHGRIKAANWLATADPNNPRRTEVAKALENLLTDPNPFVKGAVAKALVVWATAEQVPALIKALDQNHRDTRLAAMTALGKLGDKRAVAPIARHLKEPFEREEAGKALIALGPTAEATVLTYLDDADWGVKVEACKVLKEIGTAKSLSALQTAVRKAQREMYGGYKNVADAAQAAQTAINARRR